MTPGKPARISGVVARNADVAVVFRRGPTAQTQMLTWNLATDEVTPGQWVKARVFPESCDLSPNGRLLVAMLGDWKPRDRSGDGNKEISGAYTAICRPPYFTALALAVHGTTWWGGGRWLSDRELQLDAAVATLRFHVPPPPNIRITESPVDRGPTDPLAERLSRSGWQLRQARTTVQLDPRAPDFQARIAEMRTYLDLWRKLSREQLQEQASRPEGSPTNDLPLPQIIERPFRRGVLRWTMGDRERWEALDSEGVPVITFSCQVNSRPWLDLDRRGRVIYGDRGCLWAWTEFPDGEPKLIADLNANRFRPVEAPAWARKWADA